MKSGVKSAGAPSTGATLTRLPAGFAPWFAGIGVAPFLSVVVGSGRGGRAARATPAPQQGPEAEVGEGVLQVGEEPLGAADLLARQILHREHHAAIARPRGTHPVVDL